MSDQCGHRDVNLETSPVSWAAICSDCGTDVSDLYIIRWSRARCRVYQDPSRGGWRWECACGAPHEGEVSAYQTHPRAMDAATQHARTHR